jgi:hypothetical protein
MKKRILISIITMLASATSIMAQVDFREKLGFGLKLGLNYSNVYDSEGEEFDADGKVGMAGGLFLSVPIGSFLGIQPELLLSQKGFSGSGVILGAPYAFTRTTTYIDLPILIALKPSAGLTFLVGPQYSYLVRQKDVFTSSGNSVAQEEEFENDNIRKNILCFVGGADINLGRTAWGARVGWDVTNNNGDGTTSTPRYKNVWLQATFGYRL